MEVSPLFVAALMLFFAEAPNADQRTVDVLSAKRTFSNNPPTETFVAEYDVRIGSYALRVACSLVGGSESPTLWFDSDTVYANLEDALYVALLRVTDDAEWAESHLRAWLVGGVS